MRTSVSRLALRYLIRGDVVVGSNTIPGLTLMQHTTIGLDVVVVVVVVVVVGPVGCVGQPAAPTVRTHGTVVVRAGLLVGAGVDVVATGNREDGDGHFRRRKRRLRFNRGNFDREHGRRSFKDRWCDRRWVVVIVVVGRRGRFVVGGTDVFVVTGRGSDVGGTVGAVGVGETVRATVAVGRTGAISSGGEVLVVDVVVDVADPETDELEVDSDWVEGVDVGADARVALTTRTTGEVSPESDDRVTATPAPTPPSSNAPATANRDNLAVPSVPSPVRSWSVRSVRWLDQQPCAAGPSVHRGRRRDQGRQGHGAASVRVPLGPHRRVPSWLPTPAE